MNENIHRCYIEAGKIASRVREETICIIKEDIPLLEVAEYAESRIKELGGNIAFPCNISINEIASHHTPENNLQCFHRGDVVKIDIGVHIEGFIADTASTIEIGTEDHSMLIKACQEALENAITSIKDSVQTRTIGNIIGDTILERGFNPLKDLTGHSLEQYKLHAGMTIPNYRSLFSHRIEQDMVFAIEPFATYGSGNIRYGIPCIFAVDGRAKSKADQEIRDKFGTLPFTRRWIPDIKVESLRGLKRYFELIEASGEIVTQSEHTVIVYEDECEVITR